MLKEIDFCFILIHDIEAEPRQKQHLDVLLRSTIVCIKVAMDPHVPDSVYQSIIDCAPKISEEILGSNPMYVILLDHKLAQFIHSKTSVWIGVHQEH